MKKTPESSFASLARNSRAALKVVAFLTGFVAIYVWLLMIPSDLDFLASFFAESPLRLYHIGFILDSVCVLFLLLGFFIRTRLIIFCTGGLAFAGLGFLVRLLDYSAPMSGMFWFEPYLRSGVYAVSFGLAVMAHKVSR